MNASSTRQKPLSKRQDKKKTLFQAGKDQKCRQLFGNYQKVTTRLEVGCFHLQSRPFFCFSFVRTPSLSVFLSFTGIVCFRTTFLFLLGNRTFQTLIQSNMGHFVTARYDRSLVVMQIDTSSKLPATRDEQKHSHFQSGTLGNVFHGLNEAHRASFRQKVKRFHTGDHRLDGHRRLPPRKRHKITRKFTSVKLLFHVTVRMLYGSRQENVVARLGVVPSIQTNRACIPVLPIQDCFKNKKSDEKEHETASKELSKGWQLRTCLLFSVALSVLLIRFVPFFHRNCFDAG